MRGRARVAEPIDVRVSAGSDLLWQGRLSVSGVGEGSFQQSKTDATDGPSCGDRYRESRRTSLSVRVQRVAYGETPDRFSVQSSWERPADSAACSGAGKRTVQLEQLVSLPVGQSATVQGDGGLTIRLTRLGGPSRD